MREKQAINNKVHQEFIAYLGLAFFTGTSTRFPFNVYGMSCTCRICENTLSETSVLRNV